MTAGRHYLYRQTLPAGTKGLMTLTFAAFLLQHLLGFRTGMAPSFVLGLSREGALGNGYIWQFVTYMFLHAGFAHIVMNMAVLYLVGREMEPTVGTGKFVALYLGCGAIGGLFWMLVSGGGGAICIGASGATFGLIAAFVGLDPYRRIDVQLGDRDLAVRMITLLLVFGAVTVLLMLLGGGGIAHSAHLFGGVGGYIAGRAMAHRFRRRSRRRTSASPLPDGALGDIGHLLSEDEAAVLPDAAEVDRILAKISSEGLGSLSRGERRILDKASEGVSQPK